MKNQFKNAVLVKAILFLMIVCWGGYNATVMSPNGSRAYFTDVGNILFFVFTIIVAVIIIVVFLLQFVT